jgi:hypothetical protein
MLHGSSAVGSGGFVGGGLGGLDGNDVEREMAELVAQLADSGFDLGVLQEHRLDLESGGCPRWIEEGDRKAKRDR